VLLPSTADMRNMQSTVTETGRTTESVQLWASADCDSFRTAQRANIITVVADVAHAHAKDKARHREDYAQARGLCRPSLHLCLTRLLSLPARRLVRLLQNPWDGRVRFWAVAWEAVDIITLVVLDHVMEDSSAQQLQSPPRGDEVFTSRVRRRAVHNCQSADV
jgi:hypothetical protein